MPAPSGPSSVRYPEMDYIPAPQLEEMQQLQQNRYMTRDKSYFNLFSFSK